MSELPICNADVYKTGKVLRMIQPGLDSKRIEAYVRECNALYQARQEAIPEENRGIIDWHRHAGYAIIKATGNVETAHKVILDMQPRLDDYTRDKAEWSKRLEPMRKLVAACAKSLHLIDQSEQFAGTVPEWEDLPEIDQHNYMLRALMDAGIDTDTARGLMQEMFYA